LLLGGPLLLAAGCWLINSINPSTSHQPSTPPG
jgi:hypothetical protein